MGAWDVLRESSWKKSVSARGKRLSKNLFSDKVKSRQDPGVECKVLQSCSALRQETRTPPPYQSALGIFPSLPLLLPLRRCLR